MRGVGAVCLFLSIILFIISGIRLAHVSRSVQPPAVFPVASYRSPEVTKIVMIKTHKTGSTTLGNILFRFAAHRGLRIVCPVAHYMSLSRDENLPFTGPYDISLHHGWKVPLSFYEKLVPGAVWITAVRDPIKRYLSSYTYFVMPNRGLTVDDLADFLQKDHSDQRGLLHDFGLTEESQVNEFLSERGMWHRFRVVVVAERWDESMVMLRDLLHWRMEDVLYLRRNTCSMGVRWDGRRIICPPVPESLPESVRSTLQERLRLERIIYDAAIVRLDNYIRQRGRSFFEELAQYQELLKQLAERCSQPSDSDYGCMEYFLEDIQYEYLACRNQTSRINRPTFAELLQESSARYMSEEEEEDRPSA